MKPQHRALLAVGTDPARLLDALNRQRLKPVTVTMSLRP